MSKPRTYMTRARRAPVVEAAKNLASVARRFVDDRASAPDVETAIRVWRDAVREVCDDVREWVGEGGRTPGRGGG